MYICTCNNCNGIFEDTNPQTGAKDYPEINIPSLIAMNDEDGPMQACPVCLSDGYLTDSVNEGKVARYCLIAEFIKK